MERLDFNGDQYKAIEGSIHMSRYLLAKQFCKGKKVLDAACGEGYGSFLMSSWGAESVHGVDISEVAIGSAQKNFKKENVDFSCASVEDMSDLFEENTFDIIISLETIEHLNNPQRFLSELKRLCKPDGIIIISCPNDHYYYPSSDLKNPYHVNKYTLKEFKELTENILGETSKVLLGTQLNGFINVEEGVAEQDVSGCSQLEMLKYTTDIESILIPQDEKITDGNCSYYIGIWGKLDKKIEKQISVYPHPHDWAALIYNLRKNMEHLEEEIKKNQINLEEEIKKNQINIIHFERQIENKDLKFEIIKEETNLVKQEISLLREELNYIYNSRGYKLMLKYYKLRDRLFRR